MTPLVSGLILGGGLGTWFGFYVGRTRAEWGRGRAEARRAWAGRKSYRD